MIRISDAEEKSLKAYAEEVGIAREYTPTHESKLHNGGGEHDVWVDDKDRIYKRTKRDRFGFVPIANDSDSRGWTLNEASSMNPPSWYFERWELFNNEFPESAVEIEAFADGPRGLLEVVVSQPFFKGKHPSQEQVHRYMRASGFHSATEGMWYRPEDRIAAADAKIENFILHEGEVRAIDLMMRVADEPLHLAILKLLSKP